MRFYEWNNKDDQEEAERLYQQLLKELDGPLLLLASEAGSFMTGTIINVDGGHVNNSL